MRQSAFLAPLLSPIAALAALATGWPGTRDDKTGVVSRQDRDHARDTPSSPMPASPMPASRMLASRIQAAREHAIAAGVRPIPAAIQRSLRGFFPDGVLRKVRVSATHPTRITLPEAGLVYGHRDAMTLADIIVLRDAEAARFDMPLWARELSHVMQFERWGIDGFAARYIDDPDAVRSEAETSANRFAAWSAQA